MIRFTLRSEYALRAMLELAARRGRVVPAREIARAQGIPLRFLEQQLAALGRAGLVDGFRGAGGGCRLRRDPSEIRVSEIVEAVEGPMATMVCLEDGGLELCSWTASCGLQDLWAEAQAAVKRVLDNWTLAELLERDRQRRAGRVWLAPPTLVSRR